MSRIHFTGTGVVSPLGSNVAETFSAIRQGESGVVLVEEWASVDGLGTHVAALVSDFDPRFISRKTRRTMSKMSQMICQAAQEALDQAGLTLEELNERRVVLIVGSTTPSTGSLEQGFKKFHDTHSTGGQFSTTLFKGMNHSVALNLASYLGFKGRVLSPASACSTGAQALALRGDFIRAGLCDIAICGGADEAHVGTAIAFDTAQAASSGYNDRPGEASRPFDENRSGVVVAEGAAIAVLESEASMQARKATSMGQLLGWAESCDGGEVAHSTAKSMEANMRAAIENAGLGPKDIGYVNAHATATHLGDRYEAEAIHAVFGRVPVSSLKGHLGHSFAPCGTLESIATLAMLRSGSFWPTLNCRKPDPELPGLDYLLTERSMDCPVAMSNSFAMGGFNVALVLSA